MKNETLKAVKVQKIKDWRTKIEQLSGKPWQRFSAQRTGAHACALCGACGIFMKWLSTKPAKTKQQPPQVEYGPYEPWTNKDSRCLRIGQPVLLQYHAIVSHAAVWHAAHACALAGRGGPYEVAEHETRQNKTTAASGRMRTLWAMNKQGLQVYVYRPVWHAPHASWIGWARKCQNWAIEDLGRIRTTSDLKHQGLRAICIYDNLFYIVLPWYC